MLDQTKLPLTDDRVRLRPLRDADATAYAAGSADTDVRRHAHLPEPEYTPESVRRMIERDARGKGYASAALALAAEFARASGLTTLTARTVTDNAGSQRVLDAAGFEQGGSETGVAPSGHKVDLMHYALSLHDRA